MNQVLRIGVYFGLLISLNACKGTVIGSSVEGAIAPTKSTPTKSTKSTDPIVDPTNKNLALPRDFNSDIPIYPQAVLQSLEKVASGNLSANTQNIFARWTAADAKAKVSSFYEEAFTKQQWRTILRSPDGNFVMQKSDILLTLSLQSTQIDSTDIFLQYLRDRQINQTLDITGSTTGSTPIPNISATLPNQASFSDVATVPEALRSLITDLNNLGTITSKQGNQFKPNDLIQRREYARWLVTTNNRLYANRPTRQIRLADPNSIATFIDLPSSDPDFPVIQALVNAGLIPADSNPSSGGSSRRFRPNEPVSREVLLQWKIPLDLRSALPSANLETVRQAWGFQDSDRITPPNFKFVLADFKLGDLSNIRRSFGYTTLFQPQKYVTRAEAAAALWYFGTPEDGLSAQNALQSLQQNSLIPATPQPTPSKTPDPIPSKAPELPKPDPINPPVNLPVPNN
jgi:hypothetical protein